jgi:FixJ family two-component response regulator
MTVTNELIAVVDDDASARDALSALVKAFGFVVAAFGSGAAFLASPELRRTACLIADMHMPEMSGLELALALAEAGRSLPTILVTAYPNAATERRAARAGISAFLTKPIDPDLLLASIRAALAKAGGPFP